MNKVDRAPALMEHRMNNASRILSTVKRDIQGAWSPVGSGRRVGVRELFTRKDVSQELKDQFGVHPKQRNIECSLEVFENRNSSGLTKGISMCSSVKEGSWTKYAFKNQGPFIIINVSIIYEVCPEDTQPCHRKNRDIY